jgi:nitroimidazol reductase NimA-like FMN-containing flavoprotein (pyridoxamine 5'-phosphate oxidase superfamily)
MEFTDDRTGIEIIERDACRRLIETQRIGRVALVDGGRPVCLPVNYAMDGDRIVFRTAAGSKLSAAIRGSAVAFEVDSVDPVQLAGWSVVVTGRADEVLDPEEIKRLEGLPLRPWAPGSLNHWVVIQNYGMSGRRIRSTARVSPAT